MQSAKLKYVVIIADGAADLPLEELEGKTPLESAAMPNLRELAPTGRLGTVATTPPGMPCGSDICCMSLLGYNPAKYHTGRAPLEAAALGLDIEPDHWVFRVNFIAVREGLFLDHSAGHITSREGRILLEDIAGACDLPGFAFHPGVSYRNIMIDTTGAHDWSKVRTVPPHDVPDQPLAKHLPAPLHASANADCRLLHNLIEKSEALFAEHDINLTRIDLNELPATHLWPWGQGRKPTMEPFEVRFGLKGAMITAVDLLAGLSGFMGWDRLDVPGQTSYHDTDYAAAGTHGIDALEHYDIVCIHIEAPDEASHAGDPMTKRESLEAIDKHIVGPVHAALKDRYGDRWRMLFLPDHYTLCSTRKHDPTPVPFLVCGHKLRGVVPRAFSEANATESDMHVEFGHELMDYFLNAGMH
ncbi:MAG: cofactor-independent phosphoglycerate mutase [Phycisphaeraceae bacterium]|nr:cofactor-independent phosphoglycerate mutase [Phycisphaeraceae bacterium]